MFSDALIISKGPSNPSEIKVLQFHLKNKN